MLQEQYRMHPEISRFPSARFYGGRLVDVLAGGSQDSKHHALPPYAVVDVAGTEEVYHKESRIINRREAEALARFAKHLASVACMGKDGRVARRCPPLVVITFYNGQAALIRKLLVETGIEVHTVDSFQGSEAEVVLLSFVRANAQRRLGFLSEFRRLNVALTRAKHSLIVFANAALLKGSFSDDVTALFEDASRRNLIWREEQLGQLLSPSAGRQATRLLNAQPGQRGPAKRAFSSPEFTKGHNVRGRKRGQRQPEPRAFTDAPLKELQPRRPGWGKFNISDVKTVRTKVCDCTKPRSIDDRPAPCRARRKPRTRCKGKRIKKSEIAAFFVIVESCSRWQSLGYAGIFH